MELNVTLLIQLAIFLLALVWLSFVLFRPVLALLEERDRRIDGTRREAQKLQSSGGEKTGIIEIRLDEARAQAMEQRNQLRDEGQKIHSELVDKARKQAHTKVAKAREQITEASVEAAASLKQQSSELANLIVAKVLSSGGSA